MPPFCPPKKTTFLHGPLYVSVADMTDASPPDDAAHAFLANSGAQVGHDRAGVAACLTLAPICRI